MPAGELGIRRTDVLRTQGGRSVPAEDELAVEEPIEIRVDGEPWTVVMRTPGDDLELAVGLLRAEQMIAGVDELASVVRCGDGPDEMVDVLRTEAAKGRRKPRRSLLSTTSCGVCGKRAIEDLHKSLSPYPERRSPPVELCLELPRRLAEGQALFTRTGGLHAAAIFGFDGALKVLREDVGRHNAVDKCVGHLLLQGAAPSGLVLVVSGRSSFEIVEKAWSAGISAIVAVSAPSSLAVELARAARIALYGFARGDAINQYA